MEVLGSWTMLGIWLGNGEEEKDGEGTSAILAYNWFIYFFFKLS